MLTPGLKRYPGKLTEDTSRRDAIQAASSHIDAFESEGATKFDITMTTCEGQKADYLKALPLEALRNRISDFLSYAGAQQWNVILRPLPPPVFFQLDDLDTATRERVQAVSFLSLETSPGNYQAWIALDTITDTDFARRLRKGVGADPSASGATRIAGSLNFKTKYAPNFPCVRINHITSGLVVSESLLNAQGLVAAPECASPPPPRAAYSRTSVKRWPDYERCLTGAPLNHAGTAPDKSRADFTFCVIAIDWGWSIEEVAERLMDVSTKARENGPAYAVRTAEKAAQAVLRKHG